jgi:hypothetical protein
MSKKLNFNASYRLKKNMYQFSLSMYSFEEEKIQIIYSPALDLSGYGKNEKEAKQFFEETLSEFIQYTTNKGTLVKELKRLGWYIPKKLSVKKPLAAPRLEEQLRDNEYLADIFNHKEFTKYNQPVQIPFPV